MADKEKKPVADKAPKPAPKAGEKPKKADAKVPKAAAAKPAKGGKAKKSAEKQKSHRVRRFFHDLKSEAKKVVWPQPRAVWKNVGVVVVMIVVLGVVVFGLDEAFAHLLRLFMDVAV